MLNIRLAEPNDLSHLAEIETSAFTKFKKYLNIEESPTTLPEAVLKKSLSDHLLWVLADIERPVGFLAASLIDTNPHIEEFSIAYDYQDKGLGKKFISYFLTWAKTESYTSVSLTTDRLIPWNAPFYSRLCFKEINLEQCLPELKAILLRDKAKSHVPHNRIAMLYKMI